MKLSIVLFGLWLFCISGLQAQKELSRAYNAESITQLSIDANGVNDLKIQSGSFGAIMVRVLLEGETSEEIVIHDKVSSEALSLGFGAWPLATAYNDKLSAHKIVSVVVFLQIPKNLFVSVVSNSAKVRATGIFDSLYVAIEDATCTLENFNGNANIQTNRGNITVITATNDSYGEATSTFGVVDDSLQKEGKYLIRAHSIHGDVILK